MPIAVRTWISPLLVSTSGLLFPNGKQGYRSGTSFAAPFVTSIIAAMQQADALAE